MNMSLHTIFSKDPQKLTYEDLYCLSAEIARKIRRDHILLQTDLGFTIDKIKEELKILNNDALSSDLENWEKNLEARIKERFGDDKWYEATGYIKASIKKYSNCDEVSLALCDAAGSFCLLQERWPGSRKTRAYGFLAQAVLLDHFNNNWFVEIDSRISDLKGVDSEIADLYRLAMNLLGTDNHLFAFPLYSRDLFHGVLIIRYDKKKKFSREDRVALSFYAYHLGCEMREGKPILYFPVAGGGDFQRYVQKELIDDSSARPIEMLNEARIAKPSLSLSPWIVEGRCKDGGFPDYSNSSYLSAIRDGIDSCQTLIGKDSVVQSISGALKSLFSAKACLFMEYNGGNNFRLIGKPPDFINKDVYENAVALTAMMGVPYQTSNDNTVVIAIPQYADGKFVGSHVICRDISEPPPSKLFWRRALYFGQHVFSVIYASVKNVSDDRYSDQLPWNAYVDVMPSEQDDMSFVFPPSVSRNPDDISNFTEKELTEISGWLIKYLKQLGVSWSVAITSIQELAWYLSESDAKSFHQASTTTILDLCDRARRNSWSTTVKSIFGEAPRFFKDEDVYVMWLSLYKGDGRFDIYHSGEGDLEKEDKMICEMLAQYSVIRNSEYFFSSDDPEPFCELLRSRIGESSFIVMPIYAEDEIDEREDGWSKCRGPLVGSFTLALAAGRTPPSQEEWARWGMFVPRLYQIFQSAKEGGMLEFCKIDNDIGLTKNRGFDLFRLLD